MFFTLGLKKNNAGFTLVELLVVIAIVGILATIAIPSFTSFMSKAKQSEAKQVLGGLYTVESAFSAEYGGYGNNLAMMGFKLDGSSATATYKVGFMTASCGMPAAIHPATGWVGVA